MKRITLVSSSSWNANRLPLADAIRDRTEIQSEPTLTMPHLAIWHISGRDKEISNFQMMLLHCFSTHGEQTQTSHMTHCLGDSIGGDDSLFGR